MSSPDLEGKIEQEEPLRATVVADIRRHRGLSVLPVFGVLGWMAFQWGLGNDVLLPPIAATVLDAVDDGETWTSAAAAVVASSLSALAFWGATQLIDVLVVIGGLSLIPGVAGRVSRFVQRKGWSRPYGSLAWTTRWAIAYMAGASVLCLIDIVSTGRPGVRERIPMIAAAVSLSAGTVAAIVALVTTATMIGTRIPAAEPAARVFITFAKNPLTWITLFAVIIGSGYLRKRLRRQPAVAADAGVA